MAEGVTWFASYMKSGNTMLRSLLEAHRRDGVLDINDIRICTNDGGATVLDGVSPISREALGFRGEMLVRPTALIHLFTRQVAPVYVKTHFANFQPTGLPPNIPPELTKRAVYVVRDPRNVFLSFCRFYGFALDKGYEAFTSKEFRIGGNEESCTSFCSSWKNHVNSWVTEDKFPVHIVRYEDMVADPAKELAEVLEFLEVDTTKTAINKAVKACEMSKVKKQEEEKGFKENRNKSRGVFFKGSTDYREELGPRWIERITRDHEDTIKALRYAVE